MELAKTRFAIRTDMSIQDNATLSIWGFSDKLMMCDEENSRIATFNNIGQFDRFIGGYGYSGGSLHSPPKLTRIRGEKFVVCDAGNRRLAFYDEYGNFDRAIRTEELDFPSAVIQDTDGRLWVLDRTTATIACYATSGNLLYRISDLLPGTDQPLRGPSDLAMMIDGHMLISDSGNNRLLVCKVVFEEL